MDHFKLSISHNNISCIEIENPTEKERNFLKQSILENRMDHPAYIAKIPGTPFLQADYKNYVLIEFWGKNPQPFLDYLNSNFK